MSAYYSMNYNQSARLYQSSRWATSSAIPSTYTHWGIPLVFWNGPEIVPVDLAQWSRDTHISRRSDDPDVITIAATCLLNTKCACYKKLIGAKLAKQQKPSYGVFSLVSKEQSGVARCGPDHYCAMFTFHVCVPTSDRILPNYAGTLLSGSDCSVETGHLLWTT